MERLNRVPLDKRVYIDECGVNSNLQRDYGRAVRGEIVEGIKRGSCYERVNVIGSVCNNEHFAIECYSHSTDSAYFLDWFKNVFLKEIPNGCTAILDNAKYHPKELLRKLARGKVRLLFLPPYSPDYNKIEKSWANMKRHLRDNAHKHPSIDIAIYDYFGYSVN
jgi:transposase